jgi:hypothetical protein
MECPTCGSAVRRAAVARCVVLDQVIEAHLRSTGRLDDRYAPERTCCSYCFAAQNSDLIFSYAARQAQQLDVPLTEHTACT